MRRRSGRISDGGRFGDLLAVEADRARGRLVDARDQRARSVDLPQPDSPTSADGLAGRHVEIDAVDRVHDLLRAEEAVLRQREMLDQAAHCQQRLGAVSAGVGSAGVTTARALAGSAVAGGGSGSPACVTQQRALRPGASSSSVGMLVAPLDAERAARARSGSPSGIASGSGGVPSMVVRRRVAGQMPVDARHRVDQRPGVGMARIGEQLLGRPLLHHLAGVHHDDARGRHSRSRRDRG